MAAGIFMLAILGSIGSSIWFIIGLIIAVFIGRAIALRDKK